MKDAIAKNIPAWLLKWYGSLHKKTSEFRGLSAEEVFTRIYSSNHWKSPESVSGTGSELEQTKTLVEKLEKLLADMSITSILDIPCGDFKWMQEVDLSRIDYTGADIVEELIKANQEKYKEKTNRRFMVLDLMHGRLPEKDLIVVRDCLVHFSFKDIRQAIKNITSSGSRYLLATTFTDYHTNYDIATGDWRRLNLQERPFNFPPPITIINENCTENNGEFADKSLALWDIGVIRLSKEIKL